MTDFELPETRGMSPVEKSEAQMRTAMTSPAHLKRWLMGTDRRWLVLDALDLVDALPWPAGVESFMQVVRCYRDHRATVPAGVTEVRVDPTTSEEVEVPLFRDESLDVEEMKEVIRYLVDKVAARDSGFDPNELWGES